MKLLVYGYGNPGRQDDALGPFFSEAIEKWAEEQGIDGITEDTNFQLNAEDALLLKDNDIVVFVDASKEEIQDIWFRELEPAAKVEFSTHFMRPASVLAFAKDLYQVTPKAYLLSIKGYEWEFNLPLSAQAESNLAKALDFLKEKIVNNEL
jgi:hydrogenase maturation protease